ncbi:MAG: GDP-mannose 4,6-dehydratase [Acidobacteriaceae bacterium]
MFPSAILPLQCHYCPWLRCLCPLAAASTTCSVPLYRCIHADICGHAVVDAAIRQHQPWAIGHFAAEGHVDRSIVGSASYAITKVNGMDNTSANGRVSDNMAKS